MSVFLAYLKFVKLKVENIKLQKLLKDIRNNN